MISGGLGLSATGDDQRFIVGNELFTVRNDAWHFQPYIAGLWRPRNCWFVHTGLAVDFASTGSRFEYRQLIPPANQGSLGLLNDQTLQHADIAVGRWWFREPCRHGWTGFNTSVELHYSSTLNDGDVVAGSTALNDFSFAPGSNRFDVLDATFGCDAEINQCCNLRAAWVIPIRSGFDRFFSSEFQMSFSRRF